MAQPDHNLITQEAYSKKIASDDRWLAVAMAEILTHEISTSKSYNYDIKHRVIKKTMDDFDITPQRAARIFNLIKNTATPFLEIGIRTATALNVIDDVIQDAQTQREFSDTGHYTPAQASTIINAVKTQGYLITNTQKNVIDSEGNQIKKEANSIKENVQKEINYEDRAELEKILLQGLKIRPDITQQIARQHIVETPIDVAYRINSDLTDLPEED